jgi:hypothetical protein
MNKVTVATIVEPLKLEDYTLRYSVEREFGKDAGVEFALRRQRELLTNLMEACDAEKVLLGTMYLNMPSAVYHDDPAVSKVTAVRQANAMKRVLKLIGFPVRKVQADSESAWGVKGQDEHGMMHVEYSLYNTVGLCEQVPVLSEDGTPKVEKVKRYETVEIEVERLVTERKCTPLFADGEADDLG